MSRLQALYQESISDQLRQRFGYSSAMQVPRLEKINRRINEIRKALAGPRIQEPKRRKFLIEQIKSLSERGTIDGE